MNYSFLCQRMHELHTFWTTICKAKGIMQSGQFLTLGRSARRGRGAHLHSKACRQNTTKCKSMIRGHATTVLLHDIVSGRESQMFGSYQMTLFSLNLC